MSLLQRQTSQQDAWRALRQLVVLSISIRRQLRSQHRSQGLLALTSRNVRISAPYISFPTSTDFSPRSMSCR